MSRRRGPVAVAFTLAAGLATAACWEQLDGGDWFPQMKRQPTVQAFEETGLPGHPHGLSPPEGTVPVGAAAVPVAAMAVAETEALANPRPATFESIENGRSQFRIFCAPCHGSKGGGDGPVAGPPFGTGPLVGVLPIAGPASVARVLTDGHLFTTISLGRGRMPGYRRVPVEDRWDIVNYIRVLNEPGDGR